MPTPNRRRFIKRESPVDEQPSPKTAPQEQPEKRGGFRNRTAPKPQPDKPAPKTKSNIAGLGDRAKFREFTDMDWNEYAGAEHLPGRARPLIADGDLVDGEERFQYWAIISGNPDDPDEYQIEVVVSDVENEIFDLEVSHEFARSLDSAKQKARDMLDSIPPVEDLTAEADEIARKYNESFRTKTASDPAGIPDDELSTPATSPTNSMSLIDKAFYINRFEDSLVQRGDQKKWARYTLVTADPLEDEGVNPDDYPRDFDPNNLFYTLDWPSIASSPYGHVVDVIYDICKQLERENAKV